MRDRFAAWAAVAKQALASRKAHESGVELHYRQLAGVKEELHRLAALEGDCCSFLRFEFGESGGYLTLRVSGPPEAISIIRQCWGVAYRPRASTAMSRGAADADLSRCNERCRESNALAGAEGH
jgi:hypothetical protein